MAIAEDDSGFIARWRRTMAGLLGVTHGGNRDTWGAFGYPQVVTTQDMWSRYRRGGIANRIIRAYPQATWRERPLIRDEAGSTDEDGEEYSPFVDAANQLLRRHQVLRYMERADRLASIGQFGVLLMGFRQGAPSDVLAPGKNDLIYLAAYGEPNVSIGSFDNNPASPRFGLPMYYNLMSGGQTAQGKTSNRRSVLAHWSRVIHVAEMLDEDSVYGTPRLLPLYNDLIALEKVLGASAETFWLNSRNPMVLSADKDAKLESTSIKDMKDQLIEFENNLRRTMTMQGITATTLNTTIADPGPNADRLMDQISGTSGIPKRILIGSERGELSSSQDENNWAARIDERQNNFATPTMLDPFVDVMIATGNLPVPVGDHWCEWPDSNALGPQAQAEVGAKKADSLAKYLAVPGADLVVPYQEFRKEFLGLPATSEYADVEEEPLDETDPNVMDEFGQPMVPTGGDTVQDTALNGTQISALRDIAIGVGDGTMAEETAIQLILVGFPGVDEATARAIIGPMVGFEMPEPAPVPGQLALAPPAQPVPSSGEPEEPSDAKVVASANLRRLVTSVRSLRVNSSPRSLYVRRDVLNGEEIRDHFRAQGLVVMTPAEEMHVTLAHSRTRVDWFKVDPQWNQDRDGRFIVPPGGARMMDLFGKTAPRRTLVLQFSSWELSSRHGDFCRAGAVWDFPEFNPHVTISYDVERSWGDRSSVWPDRLEALSPWLGRIELGIEVFEQVKEDWSDGLVENRMGR